MADPKEQKAESESAGAPAGSNKMMMGLLGLNMVVMVAVVLVLFLGQKKQANQQTLEQVAAGAAQNPEGHASAATEGEGHGKKEGGHGEGGGEGEVAGARFFPVGDFTANLAGPASGSYVKITVNFELSEDTDAEEIKQRKPQFRDKIISLLNSKKSADLQSSDGRNYLKEEIKTVANTFIRKGKVEGVYFSAFVIN